MLKKVNSKKGHARLGAGLALLTVFGSVGMSAAPAAFATSTPQQRQSQFTNLVTMLNGLNQELNKQGTLSTVNTFAATLNSAGNTTWGDVLYGPSYSASTVQLSGIAFFKSFLTLFVQDITSPQTPLALQTEIKALFIAPPNDITGTNLYDFYTSFRDSAIGQILGTQNAIVSTDSSNTVVIQALMDAVAKNPVFSGRLGSYGLSINDIPMIRQRFMKDFSTASTALDDVISGFVSPIFDDTMTPNTTQTISFNAVNVGTTLSNKTLPASWMSFSTVTGNAMAKVTNESNVITIKAYSVGTFTFTPMLRGYPLAPITITVNNPSVSGGGTPPPGGSTPPAGAGTSTGGGGTTTQPNPNGTTNFQSTVNTAAFTLALVTQTIPAAGGSINITSGNSALALTAPQGALAPGETVSLSSAPVSSVQAGVPTGQTAVAAFGVNFSGAAPNSAITLQIKNKDIPSTALVYKVLPDGTWVPVAATVVNGVLTLSFSTDPDFVISNPNLQPDQRQILWSGQQEQVAHSFVAKDPVHGNMTTFMPIWYAMQVLKQQGINSTWNGKVWNLSTTGTSITPDLTTIKAGTGSDAIEINGTLVQNAYGQVNTDPKHGNKTTFMPIYWVFQALTRLGYDSSWNGTTWDITKAPASTTTTTN